MPNPTATIFMPYHALDDLIQQGTRAAQPDAAEVTPGTLYSVTDESHLVEQSDGVTWSAYGSTGGGGGTPDAHHASHEPGGTDELVTAAWTSEENTFNGDQTIDGDLLVTGTITPLTATQRDRINTLVGDPTGARMLMSSNYVSGLSVRHDETLGHGRVACGNYDTQTYQPLLFEVESFQVHTGVSPAVRVEHVRVHPSGGVTVGAGTDHATDPGVGIVKARGLDGTPLPLHAATHAAGGSDPVPAAPLLPYYDYGEGTPANPAADSSRLYAVDFQGFTFLETRDSAGRTLRNGRDLVGVGKVADPGGVAKGQAVYISGGSGAVRLLGLARADSRTTLPVYGLAMEAGAENAFIRVLHEGVLFGVDTSGIAEGTRVYASPTTAGALTTTPPVAPQFIQRLGQVLRSHGVNGEIGVSLSGALSESAREAVHASMHQAGGRDPITALDAGVLTTGTLADARLSAQVARRDQANTFTVAGYRLECAAPTVDLVDTSQPANARRFVLANTAQVLQVWALDDAGAVIQSTPLTLNRAGQLAVGTDIYEKTRNTPIGHWIVYTPVITATGGTATLVTNYNSVYTLIGKTCTVIFYGSLNVSAGVTIISINLPGGLVSASNAGSAVLVGTTVGMAQTATLGGTLNFFPNVAGAGTLPSGTVIFSCVHTFPIV